MLKKFKIDFCEKCFCLFNMVRDQMKYFSQLFDSKNNLIVMSKLTQKLSYFNIDGQLLNEEEIFKFSPVYV